MRKGWQHEVGHAKAGLFAEEHEGVIGNRLVEWRTQFFPIRKQFGQSLRVHDGARQNVGAGLGTLFQHHDRDVGALFGGQLFDANGSGQAGGATAYHDHVVFHRFTGAELGKNFLVGHGVSRSIMELVTFNQPRLWMGWVCKDFMR